LQAVLEISVIDSNDHSPEFNQSSYVFNFPENENGTVGEVYAVDGDQGDNGNITYSIVAGNYGGRFAFMVCAVCSIKNKTVYTITLYMKN